MKEYQNGQKTVFVRERIIKLATLKLKNTSNSNLFIINLNIDVNLDQNANLSQQESVVQGIYYFHNILSLKSSDLLQPQ